jgi:hypothetical protein
MYPSEFSLLSAPPKIRADILSPFSPHSLLSACVTIGLPTAIFDRNILPTPEGFEKRDYGQAAIRSDGLRGKDPN